MRCAALTVARCNSERICTQLRSRMRWRSMLAAVTLWTAGQSGSMTEQAMPVFTLAWTHPR